MPRDILHAVTLVAQAFLNSLRHNTGMGLLALTLSVFIWVFVTNEQNPPRTAIFPFRIPVQPVNVPADLDVFGSIETVVLRITAPSDLWGSLTEANFEATVDLAGAEEGPLEVPVSVRARDARVRVLEVVPAQVDLQLDKLRRQVVPVQVNIQQAPPFGFSLDLPARPDVQQVTVLGPEQLVTSVDAAVADVNLSAARSTVRQSFALVPRTARGYDISGVRLEPQSAVIEITIIRQTRPANLPVVADLQGDPAPGYAVTQVRITPQTLAAVGPQDVLESLGALQTQPIDLNNQNASLTRAALLAPPAGVTLLDRNSVQVDVTIQPVQGNARAFVAPQARGVGAGLRARTDVATVEVFVAGEGLALRDFNASRARVFLDVQGLAAGVHELEPQVELPQGVQLLRTEPQRVQVTLEPAP